VFQDQRQDGQPPVPAAAIAVAADPVRPASTTAAATTTTAVVVGEAVDGQDTTAQQVEAAMQYAAAIQAWADCVSEAASAHSGGAFDPFAECNDKPHAPDFGLGVDSDGPGNSEDAPGRGEDGPGNSEDAPGRGEDGPGNSEDAPGHDDDQSEDSDEDDKDKDKDKDKDDDESEDLET
jgi:hypothetical protein